MYRVITIVCGGVILAACSSNGDGSSSGTGNFKNWFASAPVMETIRFESQPPGAEAKTSTGQKCLTPCALAMPADKPFTVTYTLSGFQPDTEQVEFAPVGDGTSKLRPNPVLVELTAVPAPKKKAVRKRKTVAKPKPKPKPVAQQPAAAPPPMKPTAQPQTTSPWPSVPPPPASQ